ncbi:MAG: type II toxin-antitoxin system prevent-host-death family antitoxin [Acidobacteria bacterium]|nr:type II toxin-antitoxin system prevent-host-death family antitoxin [Acidobacteriota bacterium]
MKKAWQVQEAKARLSELISRAGSEGPQVITRHGKEVVVVVSVEEFQRSQAAGEGLYGLCRRFAGAGDTLVIERDRDKGREFTW